MRKATTIFFSFFLLCAQSVWAQGSDMVVLKKKNNRTVKTYVEESSIHLITKNGEKVRGTIKKIDKDSIYINTYNERSAYTIWGTRFWDTVSVALIRVHPNEINEIVKPRAGLGIIHNGYLFMMGGLSYSVLHLFNAAYFKQPIEGAAMAKAGGLILGGWILKKTHRSTVKMGNRYHLQYVPLK
jgi:hypothetical protein